MSQPKVEARKDPHSLAPVQIEGASVEEEIARLRSGRGLRVMIALLTAAAAVAGIAQLLRMMDTRQSYAIAASALERSDTEQREALMRCALPSYQRSQVASANGLRGALESASERMQKNYGKQLAKCEPLIVGFKDAVAAVPAPEDVAAPVEAVSDAAGTLARAFRDYREYLRSQPYALEQASPYIEKITTAWQKYQDARREAKQVLSARM